MVLHVNLKAYRALYSQFLKLGAQCRVFIQIHLNCPFVDFVDKGGLTKPAVFIDFVVKKSRLHSYGF